MRCSYLRMDALQTNQMYQHPAAPGKNPLHPHKPLNMTVRPSNGCHTANIMIGKGPHAVVLASHHGQDIVTAGLGLLHCYRRNRCQWTAILLKMRTIRPEQKSQDDAAAARSFPPGYDQNDPHRHPKQR